MNKKQFAAFLTKLCEDVKSDKSLHKTFDFETFNGVTGIEEGLKT